MKRSSVNGDALNISSTCVCAVHMSWNDRTQTCRRNGSLSSISLCQHMSIKRTRYIGVNRSSSISAVSKHSPSDLIHNPSNVYSWCAVITGKSSKKSALLECHNFSYSIYSFSTCCISSAGNRPFTFFLLYWHFNDAALDARCIQWIGCMQWVPINYGFI